MRRAVPIVALAAALIAAFSMGSRAQMPAAAVSPREQLKQLVMADRKALPANPTLVSQMDVASIHEERVRLSLEEGQEAVAVVQRPKEDGKYPIVIVQHFLGGSKDHPAIKFALGQLAAKGYLAVAIDGRYRGERQNGKSLEVAMIEALRTGKGHPFLIDTAYDITRLIDYVQTRPDVRADRIGMVGLSEGGILTWMTAAIDERIKVVVPIVGVTSFTDAFQELDGPDTPARLKLFDGLLKDYATDLGEKEPNAKVLRSALCRLVPGIVDKFDAPSLLPEVAPRPLLVLSHEKDELFPIEGAKKAVAAAQGRYKELKKEDHLVFQISPGLKHADLNLLAVPAVLGWMDRWLKTAE